MNSRGSIQNKFGLKFKESAYREFKELDRSAKKKVAAHLLKIQKNPLAGRSLGNRMGINLTGYRKIYADHKRIRIVWQVRAREVVVVILGIGPRGKGEVYRHVASGLLEKDVDTSGN